MLVGSGHALRRFDGQCLGDEIARLDMPPHNRTNDATVTSATSRTSPRSSQSGCPVFHPGGVVKLFVYVAMPEKYSDCLIGHRESETASFTVLFAAEFE
jgi:hypothetical protein